MAELFAILADPNRLRLISILVTGELSVGELAEQLDMSESAVSHQLKSLKSIRFVSYQKQGRKVFYRLTDHHVLDLYRSVTEHLEEKNCDIKYL